MLFKHFIITPYCVKFKPYVSRDKKLRTSSEWLEKRLELFKDFCLPSIQAQSNQNFTWLLFFDPDVPASYLDQVRALINSSPNIKIAICDGYDDVAAAQAISEEGFGDASWILSTRLDNDDALHSAFVNTLQKSIKKPVREFLNFSSGIIYYSNRYYYYVHPSNAFISFLEPSDSFKTVFCGAHPTLSAIAPVRQITSVPGFMQIVHQRTRSNKPRGYQVPGNLALQGFQTIKKPGGDYATIESGLDLMMHNLTYGFAWNTRDWAIDKVRATARKIYPTTQSVESQPKIVRRILGQ